MKRSVHNLRREILELQCTEEKLVAMAKLIGDPLGRLGNAQLPSGLIDSAEINDQACIFILRGYQINRYAKHEFVRFV